MYKCLQHCCKHTKSRDHYYKRYGGIYTRRMYTCAESEWGEDLLARRCDICTVHTTHYFTCCVLIAEIKAGISIVMCFMEL